MSLSYDLIIRILVGGALGGIIGLEREKRAKEAGFRTHFLVALGSTLISVISAFGYDKVADIIPIARYDPSRLAAQIVSGIGFIGAGLIIFQKNVIHGLTTAAGLWVTAAIGIACGVGHYDLAIVTTTGTASSPFAERECVPVGTSCLPNHPTATIAAPNTMQLTVFDISINFS